MQTPSRTTRALAEVDFESWRRWLERHQPTIALCGIAFVSGMALGSGGRRKKTAVVVRVHNQFRVRNHGGLGLIVRAARRR